KSRSGRRWDTTTSGARNTSTAARTMWNLARSRNSGFEERKLMFIQPTRDKLHALKLTGMADAVRQQLEDPGASQLSFEERLGLIIDHHWSWKENQALQRRLINSKLRRDACSEDIDWQHVRGLDRGLV